MEETYCTVCHGRGLDSDDMICTHCHGTGFEPDGFDAIDVYDEELALISDLELIRAMS